MKPWVVLVLVSAAAAGCVDEDPPPPEEPAAPDCRAAAERAFELDAWGGIASIALEATGFFRVERLGRRWWFVSPDGTPLLSQAVNATSPTGDTDRETGRRPYGESVDELYADEAAWAEAVTTRLHTWGFNGAGAWLGSDHLRAALPEAPQLDLAGTSWLDGDIADPFDPAWRDAVRARVDERVAPRADDPLVLGWFLGNELRWGLDWRGVEDLAELSWALGPDAPVRAELMAFLRSRHADYDAFADAWESPPGIDGAPASWEELAVVDALPEGGGEADRRAWEARYSDRWFDVVTSEVRAVDPDHLILGVRWVGQTTPRAVVEAAGPYLDVVSVNRYELVEGIEEALQGRESFIRSGGALETFHRVTGRPVLVSEFAFRARDSGLPNTSPPLQALYDTQEQRADAFSRYAHEHLSTDWVVGLHWFKWSDQPPGGRFDGENSNWGLVDGADRPYAELTAATAADGVAWGYSCWAPSLEGS